MYRYTVEVDGVKFSCDSTEDVSKMFDLIRAKTTGGRIAAPKQVSAINRPQSTEGNHQNGKDAPKIRGSSQEFLSLLLKNTKEVSETELMHHLGYKSKRQLAGVRTALVGALGRVGLEFDAVIAHRKDDNHETVYSIRPEFKEKIQELVRD